MVKPPALYKQYFIDKDDERLELFRKIATRFEVRRALYAGSFVQISPSFVIPEVTYVDSDRRIPKFFADPLLMPYVQSRCEYEERPVIRHFHQSYEDDFEEPPGSFDLLISQYAGFLSAACKKYLKPGGILLANDSHGDASMANLDPDFELVAAVNRHSERFSLKEDGLDELFVAKKTDEVCRKELLERGRGFGYLKTASSYVFRKID